MTEKEAEKLIKEFRKVCMRCWKSSEYNYPPKTHNEAFLLTTEVVLFLSEALAKVVK